MLGKRSLARPRSRMLDTPIIIGDRVSHLPTPRMKDPGNEDVLEDGAYENKKREAINYRSQVLGYHLQIRISFMHNRNARALFCYIFKQ